MSTPPPPPPPTGPPPGYQPYAYGVVPQAHRKATMSLVFSILGLFCLPIVFSLIAIVFGNQAKAEIDRNPDAYNNRGMAAAGVIVGIVGLVLSIVFIAYRVSRG